MKAVGKASTKAKNKYNAKAYERVSLVVKTGEKAKIEARAKETGQSLNGYINGLIKKDMAGREEE
ncbi:MAG: antitoxin [Acutalibacteraceae bacterium]